MIYVIFIVYVIEKLAHIIHWACPPFPAIVTTRMTLHVWGIAHLTFICQYSWEVDLI